MIVTNEWLKSNRTPKGGYTRRQVELLGFTWPLDKGWKEKIIGKEISENVVKQFETIASGVVKGQKSISTFFTSNATETEVVESVVVEPTTFLAPHRGSEGSRESSIVEQPFDDISVNILPDPSDPDKIDYYVYTDGACVDNGRPSAFAGIGIYFGEGDPRNVSRRVTGKKHTNNIAEIQAFIYALQIIQPDLDKGKRVCICTDSSYVITCVTKYGIQCSQDLWQKDIPNKELVMMAYYLFSQYKNVTIMHIKAHTEKDDIHSVGNDGADRLANKALGLSSCPYADKKKDHTTIESPVGWSPNDDNDDDDENQESSRSNNPLLNQMFNAIGKGNDPNDSMVSKGLSKNHHRRIYLYVPFQKKDQVKEMGGKWDGDMKKWYIDERNPSAIIALKLFKQYDVTDN